MCLFFFLGEVGLFITIIMLDNEVKNYVIRFYQLNNYFFIWNVFTTSLKIINKIFISNVQKLSWVKRAVLVQCGNCEDYIF